jgi:hypothetical protein
MFNVFKTKDEKLFLALKRKFIHIESTFQRTRLVINLNCN